MVVCYFRPGTGLRVYLANVRRADTWGGAVSLGPTRSTITRAVTTIIPGPAPSTQNGELFLWPGMSNGTGDLVQTTLESWPQGNAWCGAKPGQWCIRSSLFGSFGQLDGEASPVDGDTRIEILYELLADNTTWRQTAKDLDSGKQLSTFEHNSGPYMRGYGTGTECQQDCTGTIAPQLYENTVITLASEDRDFGKTIAVSQGATYEGLGASADGKTWTIANMKVQSMT
ncbi:uncharacterized protein K460DRAFT_378146 [Cucurbitaria berberidis CBS 394.84]|uniref:Uncharacterized protein n=1 Tax=Cucurbitaria berberidis CBS 394.84 TaxID=1168544 RepID=A0A9P4GCF6_9PLEO|nr:uncharacterized protein K460DRAFT_378146 [Cucurbitaria berberidis CBS 394.84]KAF1842862.1 hypothetical protein K460DRAFT_378146 [Cucurbitaria berberidis CBS 394.84]